MKSYKQPPYEVLLRNEVIKHLLYDQTTDVEGVNNHLQPYFKQWNLNPTDFNTEEMLEEVKQTFNNTLTDRWENDEWFFIENHLRLELMSLLEDKSTSPMLTTYLLKLISEDRYKGIKSQNLRVLLLNDYQPYDYLDTEKSYGVLSGMSKECLLHHTSTTIPQMILFDNIEVSTFISELEGDEDIELNFGDLFDILYKRELWENVLNYYTFEIKGCDLIEYVSESMSLLYQIYQTDLITNLTEILERCEQKMLGITPNPIDDLIDEFVENNVDDEITDKLTKISDVLKGGRDEMNNLIDEHLTKLKNQNK